MPNASPRPNAGRANHALKAATSHEAAGRLDRAARAYREVVAAHPRHAEANHRLGTLELRTGRPDLAVPRLAAALGLDPAEPRYWLSLATALIASERIAEARTLLERFVAAGLNGPALAPVRAGLTTLLHDQAVALHRADRIGNAELLYDTILMLDPEHAGALHLAGIAAHQSGRDEDAETLLWLATQKDETDVAPLRSLADVLFARKRWPEAAGAYERARVQAPDDPVILHHLGVSLATAGDHGGALPHLRRAVELDPDCEQARVNLGHSLQQTHRFHEALGCFETARSQPEAIYRLNLGLVLKDLGRVEEAIDHLDAAARLAPELPFIHSGRLLTKMYRSSDPATMLADAREYGRHCADRLRRDRPFAHDRDPDRKLRIGFVSADFYSHSVSFFFEPALRHLDRGAFELFAYSNTKREDSVTDRLRLRFDQWRSVLTLEDDEAADLIEADAIDILVDLSGHTGGHRLLVFARKPAPIQVSWLGYNGTTGMAAMDYRLVDIAEPEGAGHAVETAWRLPGVSATYRASPFCPAPASRAPCEDAGHVTFGSINNHAKISDEVVGLWAEILDSVPNSRLLMRITGVEEDAFRADMEARLARLGLPLDRIRLEPRVGESQYDIYAAIDVALDPFPYTGVTTTMDALWMGVPVVTLAGRTAASRMGLAALTALGLPELVAGSPAEYVAIATGLALDPARLRAARHGLRERMAASPLTDHATFAAQLGDAFRGMWRRWALDAYACGRGPAA